ncbi:hypothetical protein Cgig2_017157 [Carnegiea gigantea]|uniref:Uncharacterized protein n=1 Tax=Carnegiea gigantea TaxID=171969 RepID=A0A9Q1JIB3_9CARY|nr:hypothetical protein Cgig2_017157 [Carnegiea gigantea]
MPGVALVALRTTPSLTSLRAPRNSITGSSLDLSTSLCRCPEQPLTVQVTNDPMATTLSGSMPPDEAAPPSPLLGTPLLRSADDNMELTHEQCNSPTHVIKEWLPFCEELKPKQVLVFSNLEECDKLYKSYAHHVGFSVHKSSFKKGKERVKNYRYFKDVLKWCMKTKFLDCMQIAGRDPKKLILFGKKIQNVLKELKELDGGTSESKMNELESFIGSSAPE